MTAAELNRRALRIFDEACDVPASDVAAFVAAQCGSDAALHERVLVLLRTDACATVPIGAGQFGAGAEMLASQIADHDDAASMPERIGPFTLRREVGRGAMGIVYEAVQEEPRRRVAIKVLRHGFASGDGRARFRREVHLLAQLNHPGIAHVYEAGTAEFGHTGWPYFAMEFIDGLPLDQHADAQGLATRERMELLARVCDAVQHAHQKAILHRDLKMENVLVRDAAEGTAGSDDEVRWRDRIGQPKVLDFGVARFMGDGASISLHETQAGQLVGTIAYMSPEQLEGTAELVDTRTDVYALGVMLYALLARRMPYDLSDSGIVEATRVICAEEPPRLGSIDPALRGDVETIVATAMEKDRERRYGSAAELARDIRRWLAHEPIEARPATASVRLRKFASRNPGVVSGMVATVLVLIGGITVASVLAFGQYRATARAQAATSRACLAAAASALREHDVVTARRHLEATPPALRGWEWWHLHGRLDQSALTESMVGDGDSITVRSRYRRPSHVWLRENGRVLCLARLTLATPPTLKVQTRDASTLALRTEWTITDDIAGFAPCDAGAGVYVHRSGGAEIFDIQSGVARAVPALVAEPRVQLNTALPNAPIDKALALLPAVPEFELRLAFSPDERWLLGSRGPHAWIVRVDGTEGARRLELHPEGIADAAFSRDGRLLVTAGNNRRLAVYDLNDGGRRIWERHDAHQDGMLAVAFSADGQRIASGGQDGVLHLRDARTGRLITTRMGHVESIDGIVFDTDDAAVLTTSRLRISRWSGPSERELDERVLGDGFVESVVVSADGTLLATAAGSTLSLWDAPSGMHIATWSPESGPRRVTLVGFSETAPHLLVKFGEDMMRIDLRSGDAVPWIRRAHGRLTSALGARFRDSGRRVDERLDVHEPDVRLLLNAFQIWGIRPASVDWPSQRMAIMWRNAQRILVVDLRSGATVRECSVSEPRCVQLIDRGTRLAVGTWTGDIVVFDVETGDKLAELRGHAGKVTALAVIPGAQRLVSASEDRTIRLWNLDTMEEAFELRGHLDTVNAIAVAPDGNSLFSVSDDYTLRRWSMQPLGDVLRARAAWRSAAERMAPIVAALLDASGDPAIVAERLDADATLGDHDRRVATHLLFRTCIEGSDRGALDPRSRPRTD